MNIKLNIFIYIFIYIFNFEFNIIFDIDIHIPDIEIFHNIISLIYVQYASTGAAAAIATSGMFDMFSMLLINHKDQDAGETVRAGARKERHAELMGFAY